MKNITKRILPTLLLLGIGYFTFTMCEMMSDWSKYRIEKDSLIYQQDQGVDTNPDL